LTDTIFKIGDALQRSVDINVHVRNGKASKSECRSLLTVSDLGVS